jgi:hypothetical protein
MQAPLPTVLRSMLSLHATGTSESEVVESSAIAIDAQGRIVTETGPIEASERQVSVLLSEFVRRGRLHWLRGFVILERWGRYPPENPYKAFRTLISRVNQYLRSNAEGISLEAAKDLGKRNSGVWTLTSAEGLEVGGALVTAKMMINEAEDSIARGDFESAASGLAEALRLDPQSVMAAQLLVGMANAGREYCRTLAWETIPGGRTMFLTSAWSCKKN